MTKEQQYVKRRESIVDKQQQQQSSTIDQLTGVIPPRNLFVCTYCGRLFSKYSITLHQPRCVDNPQRQQLPAIDNTPLQSSVRRPETPSLKRRSSKPVSKALKSENSTRKKMVKRTKKRSVEAPVLAADTKGLPNAEEKENVKRSLRGERKQRSSDDGDAEHNSAAECSSVEEVRPATRTLSSSLLSDEDEKRLDARRICFVCGRRIFASALSVHEMDCERGWQAQHDALLCETSRTMWRVDKPRRCAIPSVDGTADQRRVEAAARESACRAQHAECTLCAQRLPLTKALAHKCIEKVGGVAIARGIIKPKRK